MRLLRYSVAASLDGYIARDDGSYDWILDDSAVDFATMYGQYTTFIMGRKTYDIIKSQGDQNPLKDRQKESVIVVSKSLNPAECPNVTVLAEGVAEEIKRQKSLEGKDIWLFGGGELFGMCLDERLVDKVELALVPVLLRGGVKMVAKRGENGCEAKLRLESAKTLEESGMVMCNYSVVYGSTSVGVS